MLTSFVILSSLKYVGFAITGFATIWGLVSKTSYDEGGRKHLTSAGKIAIATAILSALVGMVAFGFETLQKDQASRDAARDRLLSQAAADRKEAALQRQHDQELRQSASNVEKAGFLQLRAMAQQATGDALLARRIAENNARVLSGFSTTLYQIQRVQQPIHRITIDIITVIPLKGVRNDNYVKRLLAAPAALKRADAAEAGFKFERRTDGQYSWETLSISDRSRLFPRAADETDWFELATGRMSFAFFADGSHLMKHVRHEGPRDTAIFDLMERKATIKDIAKRSPPVNPYDPDITFHLKPTGTTIWYNTLNEYLLLTYNFELDWSDAEGSGRVMSQIDLNRASLLITPADFARIYKTDAERGKIPNAERVCRIDVNTGLRRLERRAFRQFSNYGEMDVAIDNLASYRPPGIYEDLCDLKANER